MNFVLLLNEFNYLCLISRQDNMEPQLQKEILERLDFSSLKWKLAGINISPSLRQILRYL